MSNILLYVLIAICFIGALFTTMVVVGVFGMVQECREDIRELKKARSETDEELKSAREFSNAATDAIAAIGESLQIIDERTNWLSGLDNQISSTFGQNKDKKES